LKLITKSVEKSIPKLYSQEKVADPMVVAKFFNPCGAATWYIIEGEWQGEPTNGQPGEDFYMYGLCDLFNDGGELGYVTLGQLESVKLMGGALGIERDVYWTPKPLSQVRS
jgi:hypothetical protein